jgi:hypothetical protein
MTCYFIRIYTQQAFNSLSSSSGEREGDEFYQFPSADTSSIIEPDPFILGDPYYSGDASIDDRSDSMVMDDTGPLASRSVAGMMGGAISSPLSVSKFQQQLSGEWNQRVLRRDKYSTDLATDSFNDDDDQSFYSDDSQWSLLDPSTSTLDGAPMAVQSIPAEVSAFDGTPSRSSNNNTTDDDDDTLRSTSTLIVNSQLFSSLAAANGGVISADGLQVLQELDADYLALRTKLLRYLTAQQQPMESTPVPTIDTQSAAIDHTNSSSSTIIAGALGPKKTYWPVKSYAVPTINHKQQIPTQIVARDHTNSSSSSSSSSAGALDRGSPKKTYWPAKSYAGR